MPKPAALMHPQAQQVSLSVFYLQLTLEIFIPMQIGISFHANLLSRKSSINQNFNQQVV